MEYRELLPRSDKRVLGAPWRAKISSTSKWAMTEASMEETGNASTHFVKYSEKTTTYLFPNFEGGNGPMISQARRSKASWTGMGNKGALCLFLGLFLIAQLQQLRHQWLEWSFQNTNFWSHQSLWYFKMSINWSSRCLSYRLFTTLDDTVPPLLMPFSSVRKY